MFGIIELLKKMFFKTSEKELSKFLIDSKLGKLECKYKESDTFFTWDGELDQTKGKEPIYVSIDGNLSGPFSDALQKAHVVVGSVMDLNYTVQGEIDLRLPEKKINLLRDFNLEDISIYKDEEAGGLYFELEYCTEDAEIMISVEFVNDKISRIDFY